MGFINVIVFPSKNLSALWHGRKNLKALLVSVTEACLITLVEFQLFVLSGLVSSPSLISAKKPISKRVTNKWIGLYTSSVRCMMADLPFIWTWGKKGCCNMPDK